MRKPTQRKLKDLLYYVIFNANYYFLNATFCYSDADQEPLTDSADFEPLQNMNKVKVSTLKFVT
jgi:hypothetical protein